VDEDDFIHTGDKTMLSTLTLEDAAKAAAGNWRKFESFVWWREREMNDADQWSIIYTSNRDSGLLDQSNSAVIGKVMEQFSKGRSPSVVLESHSHWAVGHVDGFSVLVYRRGKITKAFRAYFELLEQMEAYPLLDESHYSDIEYESTIENIDLAAWKVKREFVLPEGWESGVYSWLSDNDPNQLENVDDQGGWPDEESLRAAFKALGYKEQA
jgi:hypothetical protein